MLWVFFSPYNKKLTDLKRIAHSQASFTLPAPRVVGDPRKFDLKAYTSEPLSDDKKQKFDS